MHSRYIKGFLLFWMLLMAAQQPMYGTTTKKDTAMWGLFYKLLRNSTAVIFARTISCDTQGVAALSCCRPETDATVILRRNFERSAGDPGLTASFLRITGLLRRLDILDWYEKEFGSKPGTKLYNALKDARDLSER